MIEIDYDRKILRGTAKAGDIKKHGLIEASVMEEE